MCLADHLGVSAIIFWMLDFVVYLYFQVLSNEHISTLFVKNDDLCLFFV